MKVLDFNKEALKRGKKLPKLKSKEPPDIQQEDTLYQGEFIHEEDKAFITVNPSLNEISIDLIDVATNLPYANFIFDSYTLFLITQATTRMFKQLDKELDEQY